MVLLLAEDAAEVVKGRAFEDGGGQGRCCVCLFLLFLLLLLLWVLGRREGRPLLLRPPKATVRVHTGCPGRG